MVETVDDIGVQLFRNRLESSLTDIAVDPSYEGIYRSITNDNLRYCLSVLHQRFYVLFSFMKNKRTFTTHFNADESRELLLRIDQLHELHTLTQNSPLHFSVNPIYDGLIRASQGFLVTSGGSTMPSDLTVPQLIAHLPMFLTESTREIRTRSGRAHVGYQLIGEGCYAKVFKYTDPHTQQSYAVKRSQPDLSAKEMERFRREYDQLKQLNSPYVVRVYTFHEDHSEYILELADQNLESYIRTNNQKLSTEQRKRVVFQILRGFRYIHSKNLLHRDINPKNILVFKYEDQCVFKIADFGLVRTLDSQLTNLGTDFKGYMNDPNLKLIGFENYDIRHETYAITHLVGFIMTGKMDFSSVTDKGVRNFVDMGMAPDTTKRFQNLEQLADRFRKIDWA